MCTVQSFRVKDNSQSISWKRVMLLAVWACRSAIFSCFYSCEKFFIMSTVTFGNLVIFWCQYFRTFTPAFEKSAICRTLKNVAWIQLMLHSSLNLVTGYFLMMVLILLIMKNMNYEKHFHHLWHYWNYTSVTFLFHPGFEPCSLLQNLWNFNHWAKGAYLRVIEFCHGRQYHLSTSPVKPDTGSTVNVSIQEQGDKLHHPICSH